VKSMTATIALILAVFSTPTLAGNVTLNIKNVGIFPDGTAFIILNGVVPSNETTCTPAVPPATTGVPNQVRFMANTVAGSEMYRTALAGFLAGRPVTVNIASTTSCLGVWPLASFIFVE